MYREAACYIDLSSCQELCDVPRGVLGRSLSSLLLAHENVGIGYFYDPNGTGCVDVAALGYFVFRLPRQQYKLKGGRNEQNDLCIWSRSLNGFDKIFPLSQIDGVRNYGDVHNKIAIARGDFWDGCHVEIRTAISRCMRILKADGWTIESQDVSINQAYVNKITQTQEYNNVNHNNNLVPIILPAFPDFLLNIRDDNMKSYYYSYITVFYKLNYILCIFNFCQSYDNINVCFQVAFPYTFNIHHSLVFLYKIMKSLK